jgi:phosphoglycolate phosphatase-like HAD superfamily hydrolase
VAVAAYVFDVGETLVDETGMWERAPDACGVPRFTLMGVLGGLAARGQHHGRVWEILGVAQPRSVSGLGRPAQEIAYVGDRVDNEVAPALAAGMTAIHIRRGPWGHLHETPPGLRRIDSLLELT